MQRTPLLSKRRRRVRPAHASGCRRRLAPCSSASATPALFFVANAPSPHGCEHAGEPSSRGRLSAMTTRKSTPSSCAPSKTRWTTDELRRARRYRPNDTTGDRDPFGYVSGRRGRALRQSRACHGPCVGQHDRAVADPWDHQAGNLAPRIVNALFDKRRDDLAQTVV